MKPLPTKMKYIGKTTKIGSKQLQHGRVYNVLPHRDPMAGDQKYKDCMWINIMGKNEILPYIPYQSIRAFLKNWELAE